MTTWPAVLAGCAVCYLAKLAGWLVPHAVLERPRVVRVAALVTVALLSALFAVQTVVDTGALVLDARVPAVAVAAVLLWRRAPFVVVVVAAAVVAAGLRLAGLD
ncbi:MAG: AzlD domain-containing protein [Actinobacteria bacterium]|nr:AzlD domain-containing protein [Actinomycetota bacterium]